MPSCSVSGTSISSVSADPPMVRKSSGITLMLTPANAAYVIDQPNFNDKGRYHETTTKWADGTDQHMPLAVALARDVDNTVASHVKRGANRMKRSASFRLRNRGE